MINLLLILFVSFLFFCCLRCRRTRNFFGWGVWLLALILFGGVAFLALETYLFYNNGTTMSSDAKLIIHFFCEPDDAREPIAKFRMCENKTIYSETVNHKYEGPYCVWVVYESTNNFDEVVNHNSRRLISIRFFDKENQCGFYSASTNVTGWTTSNSVFTQCLWYRVPEEVPLRRDVTVEIKIHDVKGLLENYPNARAEIRYDYHE